MHCKPQRRDAAFVGFWPGFRLISFLCCTLAFLALAQRPLLAQGEVQSYSVELGDTLGAIADRFNVTLEQLIEFNGIADPNLIDVGQLLRIPGAVEAPGLSAVPVASAQAQPGETLAMLSSRLNQDLILLSALNNISDTQRLFPQQSIKIPLESAPPPPLRFGAITDVQLPATLLQGESGRLIIQSTRALSLTAAWNGLPLVFSSWGAGETKAGSAFPPSDTVTNFALLPVPALLAPQPYVVEVNYLASNGSAIRRQWLVEVQEGPYDSQEIVLTGETADLLEPELVTNELETLIEVWSQETPLVWTDLFSRPIGIEYPTTSPFGTRRSYNGGPYSSYHAGQDFGAPEGVPILAPAPGTVVLAEALQVRGNVVVLDHGAGIFSNYWHLSEIFVAAGSQVQKGDVLGLVGTTGLSTGAHLHWELRVYGIGVNPMQFIDEPLLQR